MRKTITILVAMLSFVRLPANDITWTFPPTAISTSGVNASAPQIAMDSSGDVVVVWIESNTVKSASKTVSGSWSSISALSSSSASTPCIVSDLNGNATAVWIEAGVLQAASKTLSGSWGTVTSVSSSGASAPALAVDSSGNVIAAWVSGANIETSTKLFGASWQAVATISSTAAAAPKIAIGGSGTSEIAVVVWQSLSSSINKVYAATKTLSGSWSAAGLLGGTQSDNAYAQVTVDLNGNALAAWYSYNVVGANYFGVTVESAYRLSGGTWGTPVVLSEPGIVNPASLMLSIGCDGIGNAMAIWNISFDGDTFLIQSAAKPLYGSWGAPVNVMVGSLYSYSAGMSVLASGDVLAIPMSSNGSSLLIQSLESDITGSLNAAWSLPITISASNNVASPHATAVLSGNVINSAAVWLTYNGTINSVTASTGSKTLVLPPSALSVTQSSNNFGVFTEYYNTLSWDASADPQATGYIIFRNGVYLTRVNATTLQFIDDNRVQSGAVTYGVAAINSGNIHSPIIPITFM